MNPHDQNQNQTPQSTFKNPMEVMQPGETVICEIKRHPIGLISIYLVTGLLLLAIGVIAFAVVPNVVGSYNSRSAVAIGAIIFIVAALFSAVVLTIANKVYWGNRWIVTSDSITQVNRNGLFDTQSSQLSLANLEDVTTEQNGVLTHMFNYGLIRAETAGERSKFSFAYCPNPNEYAQKILNAREVFEQSHHGGKVYEEPEQPNSKTQS